MAMSYLTGNRSRLNHRLFRGLASTGAEHLRVPHTVCGRFAKIFSLWKSCGGRYRVRLATSATP
ncbi:MAG: hypothetical protein KatS3mg110_0522 [Pirellulaceae bacterium]|nr:MAG: hypothetical protein KatS3mg110_0522 [Pirellulaceae bacterium]